MRGMLAVIAALLLAGAAALLLAGATAWWMDHDSARQALRASGHQPLRANDSAPSLYRWVDSNGVVNITDKPPVGRRYSIVHIDPNRNIVPMSGNASNDSASSPATTTH